MYFAEQGLAVDVREFFALPIPASVWQLVKIYQQLDFVRFVEEIAYKPDPTLLR